MWRPFHIAASSSYYANTYAVTQEKIAIGWEFHSIYPLPKHITVLIVPTYHTQGTLVVVVVDQYTAVVHLCHVVIRIKSRLQGTWLLRHAAGKPLERIDKDHEAGCVLRLIDATCDQGIRKKDKSFHITQNYGIKGSLALSKRRRRVLLICRKE